MCTEATKHVHTGTIATSVGVVSLEETRSAGRLRCVSRSTPGNLTMTGTQEDISSMISFIKFVETNPRL
jgi:hypothetical protein